VEAEGGAAGANRSWRQMRHGRAMRQIIPAVEVLAVEE
jgi:hypothetical protein